MNCTPLFIKLESAASTNSYLAGIADGTPHGTVVSAAEQTAGRGQRGNTWEAELGKNLTFSMLLRPEAIEARRQFVISEIVSVAIADTLQPLIPREKVSIKWPNDIYAGDKKICGILIENSLMGYRINHSIAGIGINVNQRVFLSDAPNPASIINFIGEETPLDPLLEKICCNILRLMGKCSLEEDFARLHSHYRSRLWRNDGYFPYRDTATGELFDATIIDVAPSGILTLRDEAGNDRQYAFKEVSAVLK